MLAPALPLQAKAQISYRQLLAGLLLGWCLSGPAAAQLIVTYESIVFSVRVDRDELREAMRREHRARVERAMANRPQGVRQSTSESESVQRNEEIVREQRESEIAERRTRWQRLSPDERQQLRRDIDQAGRNHYQSPPRRDGR